MSTTYGACALQFPSNYVLMDTEEMEYLDGGGWQTYKGADALRQLTVMAGQAFGYYGTSVRLGQVCLATAATGWGLVLAMAQALGATVSFAAGSTQAVFFAAALLYYREERKFDAFDVSIWMWSGTLGVRRATS